jgi:hypothetical protein
MKKLLIAVAALAIAGAVYAQDLPKAGTFGITGNSDSKIGAWYSLTDKIVLRPDFGLFISGTAESDPIKDTTTLEGIDVIESTTYSSSRVSFSIGLDGLYELPLAGGLSLGIGPRVQYYRSSNPSVKTLKVTGSETVYGMSVSVDNKTTTTTTNVTSTFSLGPVASLQYSLNKNFLIFLDGSLLLAFETPTTTYDIDSSTSVTVAGSTQSSSSSSSSSSTGNMTTSFSTSAAIGLAYLF